MATFLEFEAFVFRSIFVSLPRNDNTKHSSCSIWRRPGVNLSIPRFEALARPCQYGFPRGNHGSEPHRMLIDRTILWSQRAHRTHQRLMATISGRRNLRRFHHVFHFHERQFAVAECRPHPFCRLIHRRKRFHRAPFRLCRHAINSPLAISRVTRNRKIRGDYFAVRRNYVIFALESGK